jgi:hypothetical protein
MLRRVCKEAFAKGFPLPGRVMHAENYLQWFDFFLR